MTGSEGIIIVEADAPREEWLDARGQGVTASEVHAIASGGRAAWAKILDDKLNGRTFKGNAHTRRGHERESILIEFAATIDESIEPNSALWAHKVEPRFRGTPDGIGDGVVAEVKSHAYGYELGPIPPEHRSQMQWQMLITGAKRALYVREVMDEDGQGALSDPDWQWVDRDEEHIAWLVSRALEFLAWWYAECPATDDLDEETETALAAWVRAKRDLDPIAKAEAAAKKKLTSLLKGRALSRFGVQVQGAEGGAMLTAASWKRVIDGSLVPPSLADKREQLEEAVEAAQRNLTEFEADLLDRYGVDRMSGAQSLRLAGGAS